MLIRSAEISCKASREPSQATTGHPGNEKEAKGLASLTGKVQGRITMATPGALRLSALGDRRLISLTAEEKPADLPSKFTV